MQPFVVESIQLRPSCWLHSLRSYSALAPDSWHLDDRKSQLRMIKKKRSNKSHRFPATNEWRSVRVQSEQVIARTLQHPRVFCGERDDVSEGCYEETKAPTYTSRNALNLATMVGNVAANDSHWLIVSSICATRASVMTGAAMEADAEGFNLRSRS